MDPVPEGNEVTKEELDRLDAEIALLEQQAALEQQLEDAAAANERFRHEHPEQFAALMTQHQQIQYSLARLRAGSDGLPLTGLPYPAPPPGEAYFGAGGGYGGGGYGGGFPGVPMQPAYYYPAYGYGGAGGAVGAGPMMYGAYYGYPPPQAYPAFGAPPDPYAAGAGAGAGGAGAYAFGARPRRVSADFGAAGSSAPSSRRQSMDRRPSVDRRPSASSSAAGHARTPSQQFREVDLDAVAAAAAAASAEDEEHEAQDAAGPLPSPTSSPRAKGPVSPRARTGTEAVLDGISRAAQQQMASRQDVSSVIRAGAAIIVAMLLESLFVMVRDWLDTTKSRPPGLSEAAHLNAEVEQLTKNAVRELEEEHRRHGVAPPTAAAKMKRVRSIQKMVQARSVRDLVRGLQSTGRLDEAEALARRTLAMRREMYGEEHVATANAYHQWGTALARRGDAEEAERAFADALAAVRAANGPGSLREASVTHNMALLLYAKADAAGDDARRREARELGDAAIAMAAKRLGEGHARVARMRKAWSGVSGGG